MINRAKHKLLNGETIVGAAVGLPHPDVCEWLAHLGFDWLMLDMEHGPLTFETVQHMIQAMKGTGCAPILTAAQKISYQRSEFGRMSPIF